MLEVDCKGHQWGGEEWVVKRHKWVVKRHQCAAAGGLQGCQKQSVAG